MFRDAGAELHRRDRWQVQFQDTVDLAIGFLVVRGNVRTIGVRRCLTATDRELVRARGVVDHAMAGTALGVAAARPRHPNAQRAAFRVAHALGRADLAREGQAVVDAVFGIDIEEVGLAFRHRTAELFLHGTGIAGADGAAVGWNRGVQARDDATLVNAADVANRITTLVARFQAHGLDEVMVDVRRVEFGVEQGEVQGQRTGRLDLHVDQAALAGAFLFEPGGAAHVVDAATGRTWQGASDCRIRRNAVIPDAIFLADTAQFALLIEALQHHTHGVGIVLPVQHAAHLRIFLARVGRVHGAQADLARNLFLEVQRFARFDIDHALCAAFQQVRLRTFVHGDTADQFRGEQREADAAAAADDVVGKPVAAADRVAIEGGQGQAERRAAQCHAVIFAKAAFVAASSGDADAWHALQRVGDVFVRHLAHVFSRDHFDQAVGIAFLVQGLLQRCADTRHDDGLAFINFSRCCRLGCHDFLSLRRETRACHQHSHSSGDRRQIACCRASCQIAFHVLPLDLGSRIGPFSFLT